MPNRPRLLFLSPAVAVLALSAALLSAQEEPSPPAHLESPSDLLRDVPTFAVNERVPVLEDNGYYPCSDCHDNEFQISNPKVRSLEEMHDEIKLFHGQGRFWCLTCHNDEDRDQLSSLEGQKISFNESYLLCGQCHFQRQRDFFYGAHGKRLGNWQGERLLAPCTECHDPHQPAIQPAEPYRPPGVRRGLERQEGGKHQPPKLWQRAGSGHEGEVEEQHERGGS